MLSLHCSVHVYTSSYIFRHQKLQNLTIQAVILGPKIEKSFLLPFVSKYILRRLQGIHFSSFSFKKNSDFSFCSNLYNPVNMKEPSLYNKKTFFNSVISVWKLESYTKILCKKFIFDTYVSSFFLRFLFMPHRMQVCCTIKWWLTFQLNFASG